MGLNETPAALRRRGNLSHRKKGFYLRRRLIAAVIFLAVCLGLLLALCAALERREVETPGTSSSSMAEATVAQTDAPGTSAQETTGTPTAGTTAPETAPPDTTGAATVPEITEPPKTQPEEIEPTAGDDMGDWA